MKKISKLFSQVLVAGGILIAVAFANVDAQNMPDRAVTPSIRGWEGRECIQVIAPAIGPDGTCKEFPTPCDVPAGWKQVSGCSGSGIIPPIFSPIDPSLIASRPIPIMPIIGDNIETDLRQELSIREVRGRIICKELDRCPLSEAKSSAEVSIKSAKVTETGADYLKISVFGYIYKANIAGAKILRTSDAVLNIKELSIGDIVNVTGSLSATDNYLINAAVVRNVSIPKRQDIFTGTISSIMSPDTFVLNMNYTPVPASGSGSTTGSGAPATDVYPVTDMNKKITVVVTASTQIIKTGTPYACTSAAPCLMVIRPDLIDTKGSFSDMKIGMQVTVRGILDKTTSTMEAQLIILEGYAATETDGGQVNGGMIKPGSGTVKSGAEIVDQKVRQNTAGTDTTGTGAQVPPAPQSPSVSKAGFWERVVNWFGM